MASWTGTEVVRWAPRPIEGHQGWWSVDCGCCAGIKWGGESPQECGDCAGVGTVALHEPSGTVAQWPGGPLLGARWSAADVARKLAT